jgi:hypothetical protein
LSCDDVSNTTVFSKGGPSVNPLITCVVIGCLLFSSQSYAQTLDQSLRGMNDIKRVAEEVKKVVPPLLPLPQVPLQRPESAAAPTRAPSAPVVNGIFGRDFSESSYDKQRHQQFVPPEATRKLADGERKLFIPIERNEPRDTSNWGYHVTVSNPYLPMEPTVLYAGYQQMSRTGSPEGAARKIVMGLRDSPGFFRKIENLRCMPSGDLLVQGNVGGKWLLMAPSHLTKSSPTTILCLSHAGI